MKEYARVFVALRELALEEIGTISTWTRKKLIVVISSDMSVNLSL